MEELKAGEVGRGEEIAKDHERLRASVAERTEHLGNTPHLLHSLPVTHVRMR